MSTKLGQLNSIKIEKKLSINYSKLVANFTFLLFLSSCIGNSQIKVTLKNPKKTSTSLDITVSNIQVVNHQIIITGNNLNAVSGFNIKEGPNNANLQIESKTATSIVANTLSDVTFAAGKVFDFVLSNANAASTFTVNFSLCDSTLGGKGFNCSLTPNDRDVLSYDAATGKWAPRAVNGLSYQGTFSALLGVAPTSTNIGDYYIIDVAGTIGSVNYSVGDWIVLSAVGDWERINNSSGITSAFGRTGAVTATKGDYILSKMGDVDLTTTPPVANQFLKFDGTNWIPGTISTTESDPTVTAFAKAALPTCGAGEVLKSNGTTLSCVADNAGAGSFTGTLNRVVLTDGTTGALTSSTITNTELGYLSGVTSSIQTQLTAKAAATGSTNITTLGTIATGTWNGSAVDVAHGGTGSSTLGLNQLLYGNGTSAIGGLATTATPSVLLSTVTTGAPAWTTSTAGNVLKGSVTGVAFGALDASDLPVGTLAGAGTAGYMPYYSAASTLADSPIAVSGSNVGIGTTAPGSSLDIKGTLRLSGATSGYVGFAPAATAGATTYTLPTTQGTSGQVLTTDGVATTPTLSWATPASAPVSSVLGRTGAVVAVAGDYTATQITNTAAGNIAAITVQAALNELDSEKQGVDATLTSLAAYNTNGIMVQTAADTFTGRTIAGTANRLTVTNGDGVSGNPTIDIPTALLPSPVVGDVGKFLKATAADTSVWTALGLSDITTALGCRIFQAA